MVGGEDPEEELLEFRRARLPHASSPELHAPFRASALFCGQTHDFLLEAKSYAKEMYPLRPHAPRCARPKTHRCPHAWRSAGICCQSLGASDTLKQIGVPKDVFVGPPGALKMTCALLTNQTLRTAGGRTSPCLGQQWRTLQSPCLGLLTEHISVGNRATIPVRDGPQEKDCLFVLPT